MGLIFLTLLACGKNTLLVSPEVSCSSEDQVDEIGVDDPTDAGFTGRALVALVDGARLDASYAKADDGILEEVITIGVAPTGQPVLDAFRPAMPAGVMGPLPDGTCVMGDVVRVPVAVQVTTTTAAGVGTWSFTGEIEADALVPDRVAISWPFGRMEAEDAPQVFHDAVAPSVPDGAEVQKFELTMWGSLAEGARLGLDAYYVSEDDRDWTGWRQHGTWRLQGAPEDTGEPAG